MKGFIQNPILIATIIASILIFSSYFYANYQLQFKRVDIYLRPYPEHGGLENRTQTSENKTKFGNETLLKIECYTSFDCKFDEFCSNNKCYKINCPNGYIEDHICKQYECFTDFDCAPNKRCVDRKCVDIYCPFGFIINHECKECRDSKDCDYDKQCVNGKCIPIYCPDGYIQNHICIKYECLTDYDCKSDEICSNRFCMKLTCPKGQTAINHACVQTTGLYNMAQKYITPFNPIVLAKLDELTNGDYSIEKFGRNFDRVYYYVSSIVYVYDKDRWGVEDYWQTPEQTITLGTGDCEDHAILLQSLLEALLYKTHGYIPNETVYMVCGEVDLNYDGVSDGGHCWNIIEASKLPSEWFNFKIFDTRNSTILNSKYVILNDVTINHTKLPEKIALYDPSKDLRKTIPLYQIYWQERKWVELDSTWQMPFSYYESRTYPYVYVWNAFNSMEYYEYPEFIKGGRKPTVFEDMIAYLYGYLKTIYNIIIRVFH